MTTPALLEDVAAKFRAEVKEIEEAFLSTENSPRVTQYMMRYAPHADGCVISLWDAWNRLLRNTVLLSASGPVRGLGGNIYSPRIPRTETEVFVHLKKVNKRVSLGLVFGEPNWYNLQRLPDVIDCLDLGNSIQIYASASSSNVILGATGSVPNPLSEIQEIRNFIAHKTNHRLSTIRAMIGGSSDNDVHRYLWSKTQGGVERFSLWVSTVCSVAENVCN